MKYIKTIPMCGGMDNTFHVQIERGARIIDHFYFCTDEGISTHRSEEHMYECLNGAGFHGFLDIKAKAIPIAQQIARLPIPDYDLEYITKLLIKWSK